MLSQGRDGKHQDTKTSRLFPTKATNDTKTSMTTYSRSQFTDNWDSKKPPIASAHTPFSSIPPTSSSMWGRGWKTPVCIVGFYFLGLIFAAAHLAMFQYLNGRVINNARESLPFLSTSISQAYVTTSSLALVTAFRASLSACVGLCYTQRLWQQLRRELLEVGTIEELFQIRENAFRLFRPAVLRHAPVLLSVAILSWLLPVAMIYPPGAIVVGLNYLPVPERFNVSVIPADGDLPAAIKKANQCYTGYTAWLSGIEENNCNASYSRERYINPFPELKFMTKTVLSNANILDLSHIPHPNATYTMSFHGPRLHCVESRKTEIMPFKNISMDPSIIYTPTPLVDPNGVSYWWLSTTVEPGILSITNSAGREAFGFVPCPANATDPNFNSLKDSYLVHRPVVTNCTAATAVYGLNISFLNGKQQIKYSIGKSEPLPVNLSSSEEDLGSRPLRSIEVYYNNLALIDSMLSEFRLQQSKVTAMQRALTNIPPSSTINWDNQNSTAKVCPLQIRAIDHFRNASLVLEMSGFNFYRGQAELDLNLTEALLNEALANITISALTLNKWYRMVNGSSTRVFSMYHFENRRSFYIPYGLSLLFTLPVLAIGFTSLHHNGVAAIDGGFVQILMTTTGRTELEKAAVRGCLGGGENIPKELKKLKVRFGELIDASKGDNANLVKGSTKDFEYKSSNESDGRASTNSSSSVSELHSKDITEVHCIEIKRVDAVKTPREQVVRVSGFGVATETIPLRRGFQYGYSHKEK